MASTSALLSLPATTVRPRASASRRSTPPRSANWWAPILGWSPDPDYIDRPAATEEEIEEVKRSARGVVFTDEKARKLRLSMLESSNFHDAMYHSAIASRMASDFKRRPSPPSSS